MADTKKLTADSITREELESLKDLLDKNLMKYQNFNEYSARKRPNDPYIGQILYNLNAEQQQSDGGSGSGYNHKNNNNNNKLVEQQSLYRQMPVRRKIIRHTVFATPLQGGGVVNSNRVMYSGSDAGLRIDWSSPFAEYFPILIKDPFQTMMNSISEIIEYGPAADICRHAATNDDQDANRSVCGGGGGGTGVVRPETLKRSRRNAAAVATDDNEENKGVLSHVRPLRPHATTTTTERQKLYHWAPDRPADEHNGDTGPQIKRLVVRRGGVAIAGPGGIATAGSGGTAIVGPGGSAYSSKDSASGATADVPPAISSPGVSMAGYGPNVIQAPPGFFAAYRSQQHNGFGRSTNEGEGRKMASDSDNGGTAVLSSDGVAYTFPVPSRGLTATSQRRRDERDGRPYAASSAREITLPDGAKLIATGPIVYYNPEPLSSTARKKSRKAKKSSKKRGLDGRKSV